MPVTPSKTPALFARLLDTISPIKISTIVFTNPSSSSLCLSVCKWSLPYWASRAPHSSPYNPPSSPQPPQEEQFLARRRCSGGWDGFAREGVRFRLHLRSCGASRTADDATKIALVSTNSARAASGVGAGNRSGSGSAACLPAGPSLLCLCYFRVV
ncbi:hypothetical protein OPV22_031747 [Ensete ventricosum]|uniref:Uncharacterized protein n=1 Tax=Ensete ventricosum TaxID=4639 RepID=A0AAV8PLB0_ENSVE|nr:hypothetical protein OPV22_031747 [Ensete ventricosum]